MNAVSLKHLARDERADLAELLTTLSPEQWETPSLCTGWRVRDVVAHMLSFDELDGRSLVARFAKGGFLPNRINAVGLAEYGTHGPGQGGCRTGRTRTACAPNWKTAASDTS